MLKKIIELHSTIRSYAGIKEQSNFRLAPGIRKQLEYITERTGLSKSQIVGVAILHLFTAIAHGEPE